MGDTTAETKKKPPAHEVIMQRITQTVNYYKSCIKEGSSMMNSEREKFAAKHTLHDLLDILRSMHIPAQAIETLKTLLDDILYNQLRSDSALACDDTLQIEVEIICCRNAISE